MTEVASATRTEENYSDRAKNGAKWIIMAFGLGQIARLIANIAIAAMLSESAFALMAIVMAVMFGLAMFSDIGLKANVIRNARGEDPDFLNSAWTLQVLRGVCLFLGTLVLAWPLSRFYGASDPSAYELLYLIPLVGLTSLITGFESVRQMTAARNLKVKEVTKIELVLGIVGISTMVVLAWFMRSVYALAISLVVSSVLQTILSYTMLTGPRTRFRWHSDSVRTILSFGGWIYVSTFFSFLAMQIDRLALGAMYPLSQVGVYSIAASLAFVIPTVVGRLQWSVLYPWYSRMLEQGMPLDVAFGKTRIAMMVFSSFSCALLIGGASSFFDLAYDDRYRMGGAVLPILAIGAWFSCLEPMYGALFTSSGRPKWTAASNASKVIAYSILLGMVSVLDLGIIYAAAALSLSEVIRWMVCHGLGRRLGLFNTKSELFMIITFLLFSGFGWVLVERTAPIDAMSPIWQLALLGFLVSALFLPFFLRFVLPMVRSR